MPAPKFSGVIGDDCFAETGAGFGRAGLLDLGSAACGCGGGKVFSGPTGVGNITVLLPCPGPGLFSG